MNEIVFVDARSATALARNPLQIPGAIRAPIKDIDKAVKSVPSKRIVVTYCT
jgi:rhodanese-related sulfurtransferase